MGLEKPRSEVLPALAKAASTERGIGTKKRVVPVMILAGEAMAVLALLWIRVLDRKDVEPQSECRRRPALGVPAFDRRGGSHLGTGFFRAPAPHHLASNRFSVTQDA